MSEPIHVYVGVPSGTYVDSHFRFEGEQFYVNDPALVDGFVIEAVDPEVAKKLRDEREKQQAEREAAAASAAFVPKTAAEQQHFQDAVAAEVARQIAQLSSKPAPPADDDGKPDGKKGKQPAKSGS